LSSFRSWSYRKTAHRGLVFEQNLGPRLSIDETALSRGELYTIVTNKDAKGKKGTLVAIVKGTKSEEVISIIQIMSRRKRNKVEEITLDLAGSMALIAKKCFPNAVQVIDRFHVQQLATEALQEMRIDYRWKALELENTAIEESRRQRTVYQPEVLSNGDTVKQLLVRSRYLLYRSNHNWTHDQIVRAEILFERYPLIKQAYELTQELSRIFTNTQEKIYGLTRLARWCELVEQSGFNTFNSVARTIYNHYERIVNYFDNRSTNASAESFNAKIKAFRAQHRGVRDINFFLFRIAHLFA
jgi:transposase